MDTQNQPNQLPSNISINLQNCTGCTITVTPNGQVDVKKRHTLLALMGTLLIPVAKAIEAIMLFGASP